VELAASLPPELFLDGDMVRGLLRRAIAGLVPDSVRLRPDKADFGPALREMYERVDMGSLEELARATHLSAAGLVDAAAFGRAWDELVREPGDSARWAELWPVIAVERFMSGTTDSLTAPFGYTGAWRESR
jgi:hypothetical protein